MLEEMKNVRNLLKERIHIALSTNDKQMANNLLIQYNDIHWKIRNLEAVMAHYGDLKYETAQMEMAS